jgi:hypothetical protein
VYYIWVFTEYLIRTKYDSETIHSTVNHTVAKFDGEQTDKHWTGVKITKDLFAWISSVKKVLLQEATGGVVNTCDKFFLENFRLRESEYCTKTEIEKRRKISTQEK